MSRLPRILCLALSSLCFAGCSSKAPIALPFLTVPEVRLEYLRVPAELTQREAEPDPPAADPWPTNDDMATYIVRLQQWGRGLGAQLLSIESLMVEPQREKKP